ncbi:hypothetical protein AX17_001727 [Amanita inopinata Kibby_2008]|nr:hypothetical protein AX17_001727 [Amanita inopinata Kibby_2008]
MKTGLFLLGQGILCLALTVESVRIRRLCFIPIAGISLYLVFSPMKGIFSFPVDYFLACALSSNLFVASDYLLLRDVQTELHLEDPTAEQPPPFHSRFKQAVLLLSNPRGIGWKHQPSNALSRPQQDYQQINAITKFTVDQVVRLTFYMALVHLTGTYDQWNPYIYEKGPSIRLSALFLRPISSLAWAIPVVVFLDGSHRLLSLILIHARYLDPKDWAPLFGSCWEAYTVRRFWG